MSEKRSAKLSIIRIALFAGAVLLGGYFWINSNDPIPEKAVPVDQASPTDSSTSSESAKTNDITPSPIQKNLLVEAEKCLGLPLDLSQKGDFPQLLANLGEHQQEWHWDNYHMENDEGQKIILQVIPEENKNGVEVKSLKIFREDDDGPTLMEEKSFIDVTKFEKALAKKLSVGKLQIKQTVDSFNFKKGLEIKRTTENGDVSELQFQNSQGTLDCQFSLAVTSCHCK